MNFELSNHFPIHFGFPSPQTLAVFFFNRSPVRWDGSVVASDQIEVVHSERENWEIPGGFGCFSYWKVRAFQPTLLFYWTAKTEFAKYCCVNKNERRIVTHSLEAYFNFNSSWWALGKRVGDTVALNHNLHIKSCKAYATLQHILIRYSTFKFRYLKDLLSNTIVPSKPLERQKNCCCAFFAVLTLNCTKMWKE